MEASCNLSPHSPHSVVGGKNLFSCKEDCTETGVEQVPETGGKKEKEGKGFIDLVQQLVIVPAKYGEFNVKVVLSHPTIVSRHVEGKATGTAEILQQR